MKEQNTLYKQIHLLSRLVELVEMQQEPKAEFLFAIGWCVWKGEKWFLKTNQNGSIPTFTFEAAWNHEITQKAWRSELVEAARALESIKNKTGLRLCVLEALCDLADELDKETYNYDAPLEAILNRFGCRLEEE